MDTRKQGSTSEMQVTSIRLEPELKERLREISGEQGYQTLIREVLWQFVDQQPMLDGERSRVVKHERLPRRGNCFAPPSHLPLLSMSDIRATFGACSVADPFGRAQQHEQCAITGETIHPQQMMWLGLTIDGAIVPLLLGDSLSQSRV